MTRRRGRGNEGERERARRRKGGVMLQVEFVHFGQMGFWGMSFAGKRSIEIQ